jgi:peptidoglycan/LPS O-acetylase OafA/YrhL
MQSLSGSPNFVKQGEYRPDIDGLRAIAVLSVVVFHAFPSLLSGGFVGVDIFFVISGYLISKHILQELAAGAFSIRTFYARRVRRIFPALILVLLACLLFGWVILTPGEYEKLGRHVFAGSLFLSNILSWREAGYFDAAADTKPLLHLWSLGIEEQFYIVWPLLLALAWRWRKGMQWLLPTVIVLSLVYSLKTVRHDVVADFYSPVTRFWELALGALLAYLGRSLPELGAGSRNLLAWLGLGLILLAAAVVQSTDRFPGAWALLPTLGAALLIHAGMQAWVNKTLLAQRLMVWVGLISYPLYLWHWPLLSFARIIESETPSVAMRVGLVVAGVALAWLTYRFVERPVRARTRSRVLVWVLSLSVFGLGVAGFVVKSAHGYKLRLAGMMNGDPTTIVLGADRGRLMTACGIPDAKKNYDLTYCLSSSAQPPGYGVLGDSKGEALFYGLVRESAPDMHWTMIGTVYPPEENAALAPALREKHRIAFQTMIDNRSIKVVIIAVALRAILPIDQETGYVASKATLSPARVTAYTNAIRRLEQSGKRVMFVIDNPTFPDPTSCVSGGATSSEFLNRFLRRKESPRCTISYAEHLAGTKPYLEFVSALQRLNPGLAVYDPARVLCDVPNDRCSMTREGNFLYSYGDHVSDYANSMIAKDVLPEIRKLVR